MRLSSLLLRLSLALVPVCIASTIYLYLYPVFHRCSFPLVSSPNGGGDARNAADPAPFRLLALGDPQLEGDTSLPAPNTPAFPSLTGLRSDAHELLAALRGTYRRYRPDASLITDVGYVLASAQDHLYLLVADDLARVLRGARKRLDLWGNDFYLAHVYRTVRWWTAPTHVVVLGDLLGSQWIGDEEFARRAERFWERVFRGGEKVVLRAGASEKAEPSGDDTTEGGNVVEGDPAVWAETLGEDEQWRRRVMCVAGNHDVGYAGELDDARMARFERAFGSANWEVRFRLPRANQPAPSERDDDHAQQPPPELRLLVLNSMNLDGPAHSPDHQAATYAFLNGAISGGRAVEDRAAATVLLTHIPLHKHAGVCVDPPYFAYYAHHEGGGVREQNHLSEEVSRGVILEGVFGLGRDGGSHKGVVLNGHDHEGCDVYHRRVPAAAGTTDSESNNDNDEVSDAAEEESRQEPATWEAIPYNDGSDDADSVPSLREITVRSMMGEFGGNAGLLSAWFDADAGQWRFGYASCALGVQHVWWAVHVLDVVTVLVVVGALVARGVEGLVGGSFSKNKMTVSRPVGANAVVADRAGRDGDAVGGGRRGGEEKRGGGSRRKRRPP